MALEGENSHDHPLTLQSCTLYQNHSQTSLDIERANIAERERVYRLRLLLLEQDLDELQSELQISCTKNEDLEVRLRRAENDVVALLRKEDNARMESRAKSREIEILKTELGSLQDVTMDSTKLLTEKLSLARELASLKPELEHYRAQVNSHQSLMAEKLSLQRQVTTIQVELENEKRAARRNAAKESGTSQVDAILQGELDRLRAEVNKNHRNKQDGHRADSKRILDLEEQVASSETRLESMREKLKSARQQLKAKEGEIHQLREGATGLRSSNVPGRAGDSRKRNFSVANEETMIGTPGIQPTRRYNRAATAVGEKSTFSMTPFLNRKAGAAPPSTNDPSGITNPSQATAVRRNMDPPAETGDQSSGNHDNVSELNEPGNDPPETNSRGPRNGNAMKEVTEEHDGIQSSSERSAQAGLHDGIQTRKDITQFKNNKKRLLTGGPARTLFDEDEGDELRDRQKVGGLKKLTAGDRNRLKPRIGSTFGQISPRKKDRKIPTA